MAFTINAWLLSLECLNITKFLSWKGIWGIWKNKKGWKQMKNLSRTPWKNFKTSKAWGSINHFIFGIFYDVVLNKLWLVLVDDKCPFECLWILTTHVSFNVVSNAHATTFETIEVILDAIVTKNEWNEDYFWVNMFNQEYYNMMNYLQGWDSNIKLLIMLHFHFLGYARHFNYIYYYSACFN